MKYIEMSRNSNPSLSRIHNPELLMPKGSKKPKKKVRNAKTWPIHIKFSSGLIFFNSICFFSLFNTLVDRIELKRDFYPNRINLAPTQYSTTKKKPNSSSNQPKNHAYDDLQKTRYFYVKNHLVQYSKLKKLHDSKKTIVVIENDVPSGDVNKLFELLHVVFVDVPFLFIANSKPQCFNKPYPALLELVNHLFKKRNAFVDKSQSLMVCSSANTPTDICFCLNTRIKFCFAECLFMELPKIPSRVSSPYRTQNLVKLSGYRSMVIKPVLETIRQASIRKIAVYGNSCTGKTFFCSQFIGFPGSTWNVEIGFPKTQENSDTIFVNLKNNIRILKEISKSFPSYPILCIFVDTATGHPKEREFIKHIKISKSAQEFQPYKYRNISFSKFRTEVERLGNIQIRVSRVKNLFVETEKTILSYF